MAGLRWRPAADLARRKRSGLYFAVPLHEAGGVSATDWRSPPAWPSRVKEVPGESQFTVVEPGEPLASTCDPLAMTRYLAGPT
jgi:hypothetical protein